MGDGNIWTAADHKDPSLRASSRSSGRVVEWSTMLWRHRSRRTLVTAWSVSLQVGQFWKRWPKP